MVAWMEHMRRGSERDPNSLSKKEKANSVLSVSCKYSESWCVVCSYVTSSNVKEENHLGYEDNNLFTLFDEKTVHSQYL